MRGYLLLIAIFISTLLLIACNNDPLQHVDVSGIHVPFSSGRLDLDMKNADFSNPAATSQTLYHKYGSFYCAYLEDILRVGPCSMDSGFIVMKEFVEDRYVSEEFKAIEAVHGQKIPGYDAALEDGLRHWNYYFPDSLVPRVVYFNSAFNASIYSTDTVIGIALDFYLGRKHEIVQSLDPELFPKYVQDNMDPEYLVSDAVKDWVYRKTNRYAPIAGEGTLLDMIIYTGKVMYVLDAMLPEVPDSIKINWSAGEMNWAQQSEGNIWKNLATQDNLFNRSSFDNQKWLINGPFTNVDGIPQDAPPQLGIWMGWQFVRAYMKEYPATTLIELLQEQNTNKILKSYSPPR